jgi:hypothetical protein
MRWRADASKRSYFEAHKLIRKGWGGRGYSGSWPASPFPKQVAVSLPQADFSLGESRDIPDSRGRGLGAAPQATAFPLDVIFRARYRDNPTSSPSRHYFGAAFSGRKAAQMRKLFACSSAQDEDLNWKVSGTAPARGRRFGCAMVLQGDQRRP